MNLYNNALYMDDVCYVADLKYPWEKLKNRSVLISGATGLIGSFLVDVMMLKNERDALNCIIYALSRDNEKAEKRFSKWLSDSHFFIVACDVKSSVIIPEVECVDYILHLASNTHPLQYSTDPIGTITTNVLGLKNLLDYAVEHKTRRFVFASSNEVYGENRGDIELFDESYCGYINSNTLRAGYPESKRCGEALCQAYKFQKKLDVVIPRLTRSYGPTMLMSDTKALSQFIRKAISDEDIVLKSKGTQFYSYQYMADSVAGILAVMFCGQNGEAYNIADENSDIMLKDLASIIARICGKKVVFEIPDEVEVAGYSTATKARLDGTKIKALGWKPRYDINTGIGRTICIMKSKYQKI